MLKCALCGKVVNAPIEFDNENFTIYCPECGKVATDLEIKRIYADKDHKYLRKKRRSLA